MKRINADSTRRYLFARDYYDEPFLTSNTYYQNDVLTQHQEMKRKKESLTAQPNDPRFPQTGFARTHNDAPYAPDVGEGVGLPMPVIGQGVTEAWGKVPPESERVGLMPTAFSRNIGGDSARSSVAEEMPPAPALPERFARIRAHDYLRWGGTDEHGDMYQSTARVELKAPKKQMPLGGWPSVPAGGARIVASDSSGYHYQVQPKPIPNDVGL